jgi:hypothetical protein
MKQAYLFCTIAVFGLAGCATITRGTTQTVAINTPGVEGATCTLISSSIGSQTITTPATITIAKGSDSVSIRCTKECYNDGVGTLASNMEGMAAGNILMGGPLGLGVDAASGAMNKYSPQADIVMTKNGTCGGDSAKKSRRR